LACSIVAASLRAALEVAVLAVHLGDESRHTAGQLLARGPQPLGLDLDLRRRGSSTNTAAVQARMQLRPSVRKLM
jgi:hypothetical protein